METVDIFGLQVEMWIFRVAALFAVTLCIVHVVRRFLEFCNNSQTVAAQKNIEGVAAQTNNSSSHKCPHCGKILL